MNRIRTKRSLLVMGNTSAQRGDPQRAIRIHEQVLRCAAFQSRNGAGQEGGEADAVEPDQATASSEPEIAIGSLRQPAHRL